MQLTSANINDDNGILTSILCLAILFVFLMTASFILQYPVLDSVALAKHFNISIHQEITLAAYGEDMLIIFLVPAAFLVDKLGLRIMGPIALWCWGISIFIFAATTSATAAIICWSTMAFGIAGGFAVTLRLLYKNFSTLIFGRIFTLLLVGIILVGWQAEVLLRHLSRHGSALFWFSVFGLVAILCGVVCACLLQECPVTQPVTGKRAKMFNQAWQTSSAFGVPAILSMCYIALMLLPLFSLQRNFLFGFLQVNYQLTLTQTLFFMKYMPVAFGVGSACLCWFADKIISPKAFMLIGALANVLLVIVLLYAPLQTVFSAGVIILALGFSCAASLNAMRWLIEATRPRMIATQLAVIGFLAGLFAWIAGDIIFSLLQANTSTDAAHALIQIYSVADYQFALQVLVWGLLLALLSALFIKFKSHAEM